MCGCRPTWTPPRNEHGDDLRTRLLTRALRTAAFAVLASCACFTLSFAADRQPDTRELIQGSVDRAVIFEKQGLYPDAIESYKLAMGLSPRLEASPVLHMRIAGCYERMSRYREALRHFNEAYGRGEYSEALFLGRGKVLMRLNQLKRARKDFARAVRLNPNNGESRGLLGKAELRGGSAEAALKDLKAADRLKPGEGWIRYEMAVALYRTGAAAEAADMLRQAEASGYVFPEPEWAAVILSAAAAPGSGTKEGPS